MLFSLNFEPVIKRKNSAFCFCHNNALKAEKYDKNYLKSN